MFNFLKYVVVKSDYIHFLINEIDLLNNKNKQLIEDLEVKDKTLNNIKNSAVKILTKVEKNKINGFKSELNNILNNAK